MSFDTYLESIPIIHRLFSLDIAAFVANRDNLFVLSLPMSQADVWWPGLIMLGFMIGVITGFFGIGGGFLLTPALRIIFNISYPVAIGSSLLQILMTSVFSAYRQWRQNNLDLKLGADSCTYIQVARSIKSKFGNHFRVAGFYWKTANTMFKRNLNI